MSHLISVKQKHDESVSDYVKRFRETKNRCFSLVITKRDLADLVLSGLRTPIREKLEGYEFLNINQVLQKALAQESRSKEIHRSTTDRPRMHMVEHNDDNSDDEVDVYTTEFVWSSKAKPYTRNALKSIRKNHDEEMRFTFDISKCDKILDALL